MLTLNKIAITGTLSSGKSTVCRLFQEKGACVVSADEIVHQLLSPHTHVGKQIINLFGNLNRQHIAEVAFARPDLLNDLERILHPEVLKTIEAQYQRACQDPRYSLFVAEIPLMTQAFIDTGYDMIIVVFANRSLCQERSCQKDFELRMQRQDRLNTWTHPCTRTIVNNGSIDELKLQVDRIYTEIRSLFSNESRGK